MDSRVSFSVEEVDIGTVIEEVADDDFVTGDNGQMKGRIALLISGVD